MEIFSDDVSQMYFRKIMSVDTDQVSVAGDAMKVLMAIDENKSGAQIAAIIGLSANEFRIAVTKLINLGLVQKITKRVAMLDESFLDNLQEEFASIVGPMADVLIEDVISDMDLTLLTIPTFMAAELVNNLAVLIPSVEKKAEFQKIMITKIQL